MQKNGIVTIGLDLIDASSTNPRRTFDEQSLNELAVSIKDKGLLQEITVRPKGERYEIVCGERRVRAARIAGLTEIDAKVRDLTDAQVIEVQLIENCQREDVAPLEEAEGFRALTERHGYSVEDLVTKTGKTEKYVRNRLKLCALPENARRALADGSMLIGVAELVARLPAELQEKAAEELLNRNQFMGHPTPITFAEARDLLLERYTLRLADAPFSTKDADLYLEAGACTTCPKRTGNQGVLFSDVKSPDVCTDPNCYAEKKERTWKLHVARAREEGKEVLTKKEAKEVFSFGGDVNRASGYIDLAAKCEADPKGRTFKKLLGKHAPAVTIARDGAGRVHELVKATDVETALEASGSKVALPKPPPVRDPSEEQERRRKEQEREQQKRALVEATIPLVVEQLVEKWEAKEPSKALWRFLATHLLSTSNGEVRSRRREQLGETLDDAPKAIEKMTEPQLRAFVFEFAVEADLYESWGGKYSDGVVELCGLMKVDLKAAEKDAKKSLADAAKSAAAKTPADAGEQVA